MAQHAKQPSPARRWVSLLTLVLPALALVAAVAFAVHDDAVPGRATSEGARPAGPAATGPKPAPGPSATATARNRVRLPNGRAARLRWEKSRITEKEALVKRRRLARVVSTPATPGADEVAAPSTFRVATFNVLGNSHTARGGNKKGWAAGSTRMAFTSGMIRNAGVSVIGFQEFEDAQYSAFLRGLGGSYTVYPGRALGPKSVRFSLAWRRDQWSLVRASSVSIPYAGGSRINMPLVLLQRLDTGQQVWFFNVHNPATTASLGNNARWRAVARGIEIATVNRVRSETGLPIILTGDMNARADYFCPMVASTDMRAAKGGSGRGQGCVPPPGPLGIDWIFGTPEISWANYTEIKAGIVRRASDHPFVFADATVTPSTPLPTDGATPTSNASGNPTDGATAGDPVGQG